MTKLFTFTIIGHMPTERRMIEYKDGYLFIDCVAGWYGKESLVDLQNGTIEYFNVKDERKRER